MLTVYERGAGTFVQRLTRDLIVVHDAIVYTLIGAVGLVVRCVLYLGAMLAMEPVLTVLVVGAYGLLHSRCSCSSTGASRKRADRVQDLGTRGSPPRCWRTSEDTGTSSPRVTST